MTMQEKMIVNMNEIEWYLYAYKNMGITREKASVMWYNVHYKDKYLICEAKEDNTTRLFIKNVSPKIEDEYAGYGWWNIFTTTTTKTNKGVWLVQVDHYKLDKKGHVNLVVKVILPIRAEKFYQLFSVSWRGVAWKLMMVNSEMFLPKYEFESCLTRVPNLRALTDKYTKLKGMSEKQIGKEVLFMYLQNKVTIEEIEDCVSKPTNIEPIAYELKGSIINNTLERDYGAKYPTLVKKIKGNVVVNNVITLETVLNYLSRQLDYYESLVHKGIIDDISNYNILMAVEIALEYRQALKNKEKADNKRKKKA